MIDEAKILKALANLDTHDKPNFSYNIFLKNLISRTVNYLIIHLITHQNKSLSTYIPSNQNQIKSN